MTKFFAILLASTALAACTATTGISGTTASASDTSVLAPGQSETDRLNAWFDAKFEEQLAFSPITQTFLGRRTAYDQIDDFSVEAADRQLKWMQDATAEMERSFDHAKLSPDAKISWDMWKFRLAEAESGVPFRGNAYVLHQFNGQQSFFPTFLINQHRVESEADMIAFIARLKGSARALD
ncbi:MAG: DUF885 family protein, partial [Pseudomonadota bacterium]